MGVRAGRYEAGAVHQGAEQDAVAGGGAERGSEQERPVMDGDGLSSGVDGRVVVDAGAGRVLAEADDGEVGDDPDGDERR